MKRKNILSLAISIIMILAILLVSACTSKTPTTTITSTQIPTSTQTITTTTQAPDTTPPVVSSTINADGATGVSINTKVGAVFTEVMQPLTTSTFIFQQGQANTPVAGTVTTVGTMAIFTPATALLPDTIYTATITTGAEDLAGNALASPYIWRFTTGETPDNSPPSVNNTLPANGETGVHPNTAVLAVFSKGMDPGTFTSVSFTLQQGTTPVTGTVALTAATAIFTPAVNLTPGTLYTATISSVVKDVEGNELASNYIWSFNTGAAPDTTPPIVTSTIPANAATNVVINSAMAAVFDEAMNPLTITPLSFTLKQGTTPVNGTVTYAGNIATFTPTIDLTPNTVYTAMINTGAKDLAGNALASTYTWSFTTLAVVNPGGGGGGGGGTPAAAPTVTSMLPVSGSVTGGTSIAITGTGFVNNATVNIGGAPATSVVWVNATLITAITPTGTAGAQDVVVTNPDAQHGTLTGGFTYIALGAAPTVTAILQTEGPTTGGTSVIITGTGFVNGATVKIGGASATGVAWVSATSIAATIPAGTAGAQDVVVTNPDAQFGTLTGGFTYIALAANPTAPNLGEAGRFVILASQTITTTPGSLVYNGDLGVMDEARSYAAAGFTPTGSPDIGALAELTNGLSYASDDVNPIPFPYPLKYATAVIGQPWASTLAMINQVRTDEGFATSFLEATNPTAANIACPSQLGTLHLTRGVYKTAVDVLITTGPLYLDAQGDPNSVWIFDIGGTLTIGAPSGGIILENGALAKNVYFRTQGLTKIEAGMIVQGNIFAKTQVNVLAGANITGRLFASTAQVTLDSDTVTKP